MWSLSKNLSSLFENFLFFYHLKHVQYKIQCLCLIVSWFFRLKLLPLLFFSIFFSSLESDFIIDFFCPTTLSYLYSWFWWLYIMQAVGNAQLLTQNPRSCRIFFIWFLQRAISHHENGFWWWNVTCSWNISCAWHIWYE